ncbi:MAG: acetyl-CoA carboxylase biotin carboxyl carrier protein [Acetatifactor sp.]|nr:acetyl-CoA carboxylase biotin carboxyl carrier protein [Acetatifactor sp.]
MEFNQVLELIKTVSASELTTFRYEEGNQKILMHTGNVVLNEMAASQSEAVASVQSDTTVTDVVSTASVVPSGKLVKSPLVGRFYAAPSEDAEPFVKVGDRVQKGQTLAIVEAMKLMNEIESEYDGVVTEILVENEQSVEYGQPLFSIS